MLVDDVNRAVCGGVVALVVTIAYQYLDRKFNVLESYLNILNTVGQVVSYVTHMALKNSFSSVILEEDDCSWPEEWGKTIENLEESLQCPICQVEDFRSDLNTS